MVCDLNFDIEIIGCPIIREEDGLAKSSRNTYLSDEERQAALVLSKAVILGKSMAESGEKDACKIVNEMKQLIEKEPMAKIDYVKAVNAETISPISVSYTHLDVYKRQVGGLFHILKFLFSVA